MSQEMEAPDRESCCLGPPPPKFILRPPPPPSPLDCTDSFDFLDNSTSDVRMCQILSVIDAEYHFGQLVPSVAIVVVVAAATVLVFCCIGIILVVLKRRKLRHLLPRKSSPQNQCRGVNVSGIIYEDFGNVLSESSPDGQPSETIRINPYSSNPMIFSSLLIRAHQSARTACDYRNLFSPECEDSNDNPFYFEKSCENHYDDYANIVEDEPRFCDINIKQYGENSLRDESVKENIYECLDPPEDEDDKNEYFCIDEVDCKSRTSSAFIQPQQQAPERSTVDKSNRVEEADIGFTEVSSGMSDIHDDPLLEAFFHFCSNSKVEKSSGQTKNLRHNHSRCEAENIGNVFTASFPRLCNRLNQNVVTTVNNPRNSNCEVHERTFKRYKT